MISVSIKNLVYAFSPSSFHSFIEKIEYSDVGKRLAVGIFWSMAGSVISRGLMLCASVLVARILGRTVYGELGMMQSTIGMFGVIAGFGLGLTATKHVAEFRKSDPDRAGRVIGLSGLSAVFTGGIMALGLFISAPWLAENSINAPHLVVVLRIGAIILLINALNGAQTGALAGFEAFKAIAFVNLLVGLMSFPILVGGAYYSGLTGAVCALAINLALNWALNHIALRKEAKRHQISLNFKNCCSELPILWQFSLPAAISGIMFGPVSWVCNTMLVKQPNGYSEMGLFNAALVFQQLLLFASGMLNGPLLSMLSYCGPVKSKRLEATNILSSWLLGLVPAIPLLCFPEIIEIFLGVQYRAPSFRSTFGVIVFYTCILTYRAGLLRVLQAKSLLWWGFANNLLWAMILLPTTYLMAKSGALGLSLSYGIAYLFTSIIFVPVYMKYGDVPRELILSKEVIFVWIIVAFLTLSVFFNIPIFYRCLAMPILFFIVFMQLKSIWVKNTN